MQLGKYGKLKGQKHPRDLRRIDPEPSRPTPATTTKRKVAKPYGYSYEHHRYWWRKDRVWVRKFVWFATEHSRDQSMRAFQRSAVDLSDLYRGVRPETVSREQTR